MKLDERHSGESYMSTAWKISYTRCDTLPTIDCSSLKGSSTDRCRIPLTIQATLLQQILVDGLDRGLSRSLRDRRSPALSQVGRKPGGHRVRSQVNTDLHRPISGHHNLPADEGSR